MALPDQLFYNTGISTYFWIVTNRKSEQRKGKVQLVDARDYWTKMRKSLGDKRKELSDEQIADITRLYANFTEGEQVKIFPNTAFGYQRITVERPLHLRWEVTADTLAVVKEAKAWAKLSEDDRVAVEGAVTALVGTSATDKKVLASKVGSVPKTIEKALWDAIAVTDPTAPVVTNKKGAPEADSDLRDNENVPLPDVPVKWVADTSERLATTQYRGSVEHYMAGEVLPFVDDAWVDWDKTKIGYEIPLTRYFYKYVPPRPLAEIDAEIKALEAEIQALLGEVTE